MTISLRIRFGLAALALVSACTLPAARADDDARRAAFVRALAEQRSGLAPTLTPSLRDYVLWPYLDAVRLQTALPRAPQGSLDAEIRGFLAAQPDLVITRELRRAWLLDLAARGEWTAFLAADDAGDTDATLVCQRFAAQIATQPDAALAALRAYWPTAKQMPSACVAPFDWLRARGGVDAAAIEARARKALADGNAAFAGSLIGELPAARAAPLRLWQQLLEDPRAALAALNADPARVVEPQALQAGVDKLSRRGSRDAAEWLAQFDAARIPAPDFAALRRAVALGLAWDRRAEALNHFRLLPDAALDERAHEWRIRAALWNNEWALAAQWLAALPPTMAAEPRWTYWRARVADKLGRSADAKASYAQLARDNGYYSVLSAWRADAPYAPRVRQLATDQAAQQRLLALPALQRARELYAIGEIHWATAEWRRATDALAAPEREQAAQLASRWGWHWQTVLLLNQTGSTDALDLLYPQAYMQEIARGAKQASLPPAWVYGVMRQESIFLPQAQSAAPAYGLLQLKLETARDVARKLGAPKPSRDDLFDPATNVRLGTAYLRQMTDRFGGQFVLTLASYNAGPNAVARWLPERPVDADVWIENVPFNETRGYVQRILWHITVHNAQRGEDPHDLDALLRPVHRPAP